MQSHKTSLSQRGVQAPGFALALEETESVFNRGSTIPGETNSSYSLRVAKVGVAEVDGASGPKVHQDLESSFSSAAQNWLEGGDQVPDQNYLVGVR